MRFEEFHHRFPEVAERETRTATVCEHPHLPAGTYAFTECFCATRGCDCRRSLILVRSREAREVVATLNYGWESTAFYKKWASGSASMARMMTGVSVAPWGTQTGLSDALAVQFASMVQDQEYAKRIQRHYAMYKQALDATADDAGDDVDDKWDDDDLPDPETATEEECFAVLADFDVHPRREWFTMRAAGCDAANTLLQTHASSLASYDRHAATGYVTRLWELWLPETPCLETRYARAVAHCEAARTAATPEEDLHHRRKWLEALEAILLDSTGHVRVDVLQALVNEDWDLQFDGVLISLIPMMLPPATEEDCARIARWRSDARPVARRLEVRGALEHARQGQLKRALEAFNRLARQLPESVAVHLAAGSAILALSGQDARLLRQAEWFLERAHRQSEDLPVAAKVSVLDALIQFHERTGAVQKAESLRGARDALLTPYACDDD